MVSVIVTTWQPGPGLDTAIRSLVNQSWRNIEILLVDDGSSMDYRPLLDRAAALDPRIRLLCMECNGGTYEARNAALRAARGEFIAGQDSDDWSHPRRIERQAKALIANHHLVSTGSLAFRCDHRLVFNAPGTRPRGENASSLMFRRAAVLEGIGFYDSTRKGGDTEYMLRIRRAFGEQAHETLEQPLAVIRQSRGSLSGAEFRPGWRHPARAAYRRSYEFWHGTSATRDLRLDGKDAPRAFPLPDRFRAGNQTDTARTTPDLVFADDLRGASGVAHLSALLDEINECLRAGLVVAVMHLRSLRDMSVEHIDSFWAPIARLLHEGKLHEVFATDDLSPALMVVRRPEVAMFLAPDVAMRPQRVVMAACDPPLGSDGHAWYDPESCDRNVCEAFGCPPEWRPDPEIARVLRRLLPKQATIGPPYPIVVDAMAWRSPARQISGRSPVVGRIVEAGELVLPGKRDVLLSVYAPKKAVSMRFLGGMAALHRILGKRRVPANWTIVPEGSVSPDVFLSGCDFFVYFDGGEEEPTPKRLFAQALASGCVVITSPHHARSLGEAAIPAQPGQVYGVVEAMFRDPDAYAGQVRLGLKFVEEFAGAGFPARLGVSGTAGSSAPTPARTDTGPAPDPGTHEVVQDLLKIAMKANELIRLDATILRTSSDNGRELLARWASRGSLSHDDIVRYAEAVRAPSRRVHALRMLGTLDPVVAVRLARVMIVQALWPDDRVKGLSLCEAVVACHGPSVVPRRWSRLFVDAALLLGLHTTAANMRSQLPLRESDRQFVDIDLAHPDVLGTEPEWLAAFNSLFRQWSLNEMRLGPASPGLSRFDRVDFLVPQQEYVEKGEKVSVIMTAWRPTVALHTALRSILAQTWKNLEVLLIDDCSPPGHEAVLDECRRMDPRVRVLRQPENRGTYMARNLGLSMATGDFVTFQDADDYSHPKRIELQIRPMLEDPALMATKSGCARVDDRLLLANPGSPSVQGNASSLMIRRAPVLEKIGYFDTIRKAADTEYALRIGAAFSQEIFDLGDKLPLALVRLESNSLSRAEFKPGWRHPARAAYREAYLHWHEKIRAGEASPFLAGDPGVRAFPAQHHFRLDRNGPAAEYDVVFIGDWRQYGGPQKSMLEEIRALHKAGQRLAICHMEAFRFMTPERQPLCAEIRALIHEGLVAQVTTPDDIVVHLAILRYPPILQYLEAGTVGWKLGAAIIVANQAPSERDGSDVRYCVSDCIRNARTLFGLDPTWVPQGPQVREALQFLISPAMLDPLDMPGVVDPAEWRLQERESGNPVAVIGRYSRDNALKFPATAEDLLAAYPAEEGIRVKIMGGERTCRNLLGDRNLPDSWELIGYGTKDVKDFLRELDYFVYFDNDQIVEAFGRSILEAIASGRVVVLPEKFRPVFGDAAVYCKPAEVGGLIRELQENPGRRSALRQRAARELQSRFSHEAYIRRIASFLPRLRAN